MKNELQKIKSLIFEIRGRQVILDEDLARIYQVETRRLNEAVKRNIDRFPPEFMFQLIKEEYEILKSQIATSSWGGRRKLPNAFTGGAKVSVTKKRFTRRYVEPQTYALTVRGTGDTELSLPDIYPRIDPIIFTRRRGGRKATGQCVVFKSLISCSFLIFPLRLCAFA